jgi:hypothetical protein
MKPHKENKLIALVTDTTGRRCSEADGTHRMSVVISSGQSQQKSGYSQKFKHRNKPGNLCSILLTEM